MNFSALSMLRKFIFKAMNSYAVPIVILMILIVVNAAEDGKSKTGGNLSNGQQVFNGNVAVDEVVVESSLYIKPKPRTQLRRTRRYVWEKLVNIIPFSVTSL